MKTSLLSASRRWLSLVAACLLTTLIACQDHVIPTPPEHGLRIARITSSGGHSLIRSDFYYDEQKRLARLETYQPANGIPQSTTTYFYNGDNRLVRIEDVSRREEGVGGRTLVTYNAAGRPQMVSFYNLTNGLQTATLFSTNEYHYNAGGQLTGYTKRYFPSSQRSEYQYTYTGKNVTQITLTVYQEGQSTPSSTQQTQYTFDDKPNPYKGLFGYNPDAPYQTINENNIIGPDRELTYNSQGLLTRIFFPSPIVPGTLDIEYAPY